MVVGDGKAMMQVMQMAMQSVECRCGILLYTYLVATRHDLYEDGPGEIGRELIGAVKTTLRQRYYYCCKRPGNDEALLVVDIHYY